ncbi:MAG: hypothetical protein QW560_00685 [Candidatus Nitrosocaldus sp.]
MSMVSSSTTLTIGLMAPVIALGVLLAYLSSTNSHSGALELPEHMLKVPEEYQNKEEVKEMVSPEIEPLMLEFVFPNYTHFIEISRGESITIPVTIYSVDNRTLDVKIYVYSEETTSLAQVEHESSMLPVKRFPDGINAYADVEEVKIPAYHDNMPEEFSTWENEARKVTFNLTIEASKDAEPRMYSITVAGSVKWEFEDITIIDTEGNPLYITVK